MAVIAGQAGGPEQQDLAVECPGCECFQYLAGLDRAGRQTEDDEIRPLGVKHRAQLRSVPAFARDETKFFQGLHEKGSNVILAIGDAGARPDFSPAERNDARGRFGVLMSHECPPCIDGRRMLRSSLAQNVAFHMRRPQLRIKLNRDN
jgi:hypothetical protein